MSAERGSAGTLWGWRGGWGWELAGTRTTAVGQHCRESQRGYGATPGSALLSEAWWEQDGAQASIFCWRNTQELRPQGPEFLQQPPGGWQQLLALPHLAIPAFHTLAVRTGTSVFEIKGFLAGPHSSILGSFLQENWRGLQVLSRQPPACRQILEEDEC